MRTLRRACAAALSAPLFVAVTPATSVVGAGASAPLASGVASAPSAHAAGAWTWPLRGEVITPYRNGHDPYAAGQHRGVDLAGKVGEAVVAAAGGTVRFVGTPAWSGLTVTVRTADGRFDTSYLHLSRASVREGERVRTGERLGAVGTTGRRSAEQPHLHFSVRDAGRRHAYHDPLDFLPPLAAPRAAPRPLPPVPIPLGAPIRPSPAPLRRHAPRPVGAQSPHPAPLPGGRRVPVPGAAPRRFPVRGPRALPAPAPVPVGSPGRPPSGVRAPALGPAPDAGPHPTRSPAADRSAPTASPSPAGGPDVGFALACAGLLLAAAFLGGTEEGRAAASRGRARLGAVLRPLIGGRG